MTDAGGYKISASELDALLEKAATRGAERALRELGLEDPDDRDNLKEALGLGKSWKKAKDAVVDTTVKIITAAILGALALGLFVKLGNKLP